MNTRTMRNASNNKKWNVGVVKLHVETPHITLIKSKHDEKSDKDFVNIKFCRDTTSENSDLYELKTAFIENSNTEEFLLFVPNSSTNI